MVFNRTQVHFMGIIIRQSLKGTFVNYVGIAIGFVTTFFVLTHYLSSEEIGLTRVLVDTATLFASFAQLGTSASILRFYPYFNDEKGNDHGFFFWTIVVPLAGFILFVLVLLLFHAPIIQVFAEKSPLFVKYFRFVVPISLFMLYQTVFESNANVLMRIVVPKFVREVGIRLGFLVIYILYGTNHLTLNGLIVGFCIIYLAAAIINIVYLFTLKRISIRPDFRFITKTLRRNFLSYTSFLILAALAGNITPLLNSFFVSAQMGLVYTGVFAIANYIATIIEIPNRSLNAIAQPNISIQVKEGNTLNTNSLCRSVSLHQLLSSTLIFVLIWINIDLFFDLLPNGSQYAAGKNVVLILGIMRLLTSTLSIAASPLNYSRYYYLSLVCTVILTLTAITLNALLIPRLGIDGAALASLLSYMLYYALLLGMVKRKLDVNIFSQPQLKVIVVIAAMMLINTLWVKWLSPMIYTYANLSTLLKLVEAALRTGILAALATAAIYFWKISNEVNSLIDKFLRWIFPNFKQNN